MFWQGIKVGLNSPRTVREFEEGDPNDSMMSHKRMIKCTQPINTLAIDSVQQINSGNLENV